MNNQYPGERPERRPGRKGKPERKRKPDNFFSGLFDFSFQYFITKDIVKILYIVLICISILGGLSFLGAGLSQGNAEAALISFFVAPVIIILGVIYSRLVLEMIIVIFSVEERLTEIKEEIESGP